MFLSWGWGVGAEVRVPVCVGCEWIFFFCTKTAGVTEVVRTGGRLICPPSPPSHQPSALQDLDDPLGRQAVAHSPALAHFASSPTRTETLGTRERGSVRQVWLSALEKSVQFSVPLESRNQCQRFIPVQTK